MHFSASISGSSFPRFPSTCFSAWYWAPSSCSSSNSVQQWHSRRKSMFRKNAARAATRTNSRLQAFVLLLLGMLCVLAAWLLHPNPFAYPVGVFVLGLGLLLAAALNPYRLLIGGILTTLLGMAVFLSFQPIIPVLKGQDLVTFLLAIGLALLGIAVMTRRGFIGAGAVTPGLIVVAVAS